MKQGKSSIFSQFPLRSPPNPLKKSIKLPIPVIKIQPFISWLEKMGENPQRLTQLLPMMILMIVGVIMVSQTTWLRAWSILDCPFSPLDFNPLDLAWLDTTKVYEEEMHPVSALNCWLKCMLLDAYNQTDHPECKSRPDSGLSAITELDPGYITGPLSSVWKEWVKWCIQFGIEANAIIAVPYDWRLPPSKLEELDLYFHKLNMHLGKEA
ncbi:Phospholipid--sterol O-acyltransferase-like protein [Drosera capensis]